MSLEKLPYELKLEILKKIDNIDLLKDICSTSESYKEVCKQNWETLINNIEYKYSVVQLENYSIYDLKEFRSEKDAIDYFKKEVKEYNQALKDYSQEYNLIKDIIAAMIKLTYDDESDKIRSFLLCGLSRSRNKQLVKELYKELGQIEDDEDEKYLL